MDLNIKETSLNFNGINYKAGDVILFAMLNGNFMIGRVVSIGGTAIQKMRKPRLIVPQGGANGQVSISFIPLGAPFFDENDSAEIDFPVKGTYLLSKKADKQLSDGYLQVTSGLVPASGMGGLPGLGGMQRR